MSMKQKIGVVAVTLLVLVAGGLVWLGPAFFSKDGVSAAANLPYNTTAKGPYRVKGNMILGVDGRQYIFHGIGRGGFEYNCSGEGPLDRKHLAYMGHGRNTRSETYWGANTVRLPLSANFWLRGEPGTTCTAQKYREKIAHVVNTLTSLRMNVMLDLQLVGADRQSPRGGGSWELPDGESLVFWRQVAAIYKSYPNVIFELYNEPHPLTWECWAYGCRIKTEVYSPDCDCKVPMEYQGVGMRRLVEVVRNTGATNLLVVAGMSWGYDLSQVERYNLQGNIVYDTHPYPYPTKLRHNWDYAFGGLSRRHPVISAEHGQYDCKSDYLKQLYDYFDAHRMGWVAWAWTTAGDRCGYPHLIQNYKGTPAEEMGSFIYQRLRGYMPRYYRAAALDGPKSRVWHFADGHVGDGFKEFITLGNPDPHRDCKVRVQYLPERGYAVTKEVIIPQGSRQTLLVNNDLGIAQGHSPGRAVSTIIAVINQSCDGIVAERPLYVARNGLNTGTNVMGATTPDRTFYFADIATGDGNTSSIALLNPPDNEAASVRVTYYSGGKVEEQQIVVQAGRRATIMPAQAGLPAHVAAIVKADQPIIAERSTYFTNIRAGNAGVVSGATTVQGVRGLEHSWNFAEGYTGAGFQQYLTIANMDENERTARVTIVLQFENGGTKEFPLSVPALSQAVWNVNHHAPGQSVSAHVRSENAAVVVQRQMYFQYRHTVAGSKGFSISSMGGTDVVGQPGSLRARSYSFAEGYNARGYNEWLVLQNPGDRVVTLNVSLVNAYGNSYVRNGLTLRPHSRTTLDITALVLKHLVNPGDDHRAYEVTMTVQTKDAEATFVAERTMYWNNGSSQGGTGVIGFSGLEE